MNGKVGTKREGLGKAKSTKSTRHTGFVSFCIRPFKARKLKHVYLEHITSSYDSYNYYTEPPWPFDCLSNVIIKGYSDVIHQRPLTHTNLFKPQCSGPQTGKLAVELQSNGSPIVVVTTALELR